MNNLNATCLINDVNAAGCLLQLVRICIAVWAALRLRCYYVLRAGLVLIVICFDSLEWCSREISF